MRRDAPAELAFASLVYPGRADESYALEVFRDPGPEGYQTVRSYREAEPAAPLAIPDLVVSFALLTSRPRE